MEKKKKKKKKKIDQLEILDLVWNSSKFNPMRTSKHLKEKNVMRWSATSHHTKTTVSLNKQTMNYVVYLLETAHEVVADWRSRQVGGAGASTHIEEVIRTQHGVVLLGVTRGGQNSIYWYRHLTMRSKQWGFLFFFFFFCLGFWRIEGGGTHCCFRALSDLCKLYISHLVIR